MKHKLETSLSTIFVYVIYVMGIYLLGFLLYNIIIRDTENLIFLIVALLFLYLMFFRKIWRFKSFTFDSSFIYADNKTISFQVVSKIEKGKITYIENDLEKVLYFNFYFIENFKILLEYYRSVTKIK